MNPMLETTALLNDSSDSKVMTVETVDNHIYFYSRVNADRTLDLIKRIRETDTRLRNEQISRNVPESTPIWLHIQSPGGGLFAGLSVSDQLKQIKTPIYSIVEGYCASAATLISMSCNKRFIQPSAFVMIHQLSSIAWGKYSDIIDEVHLLDMAMHRLEQFYIEHSNLNEKVVKELLSRNSWFNAMECIEHGLVDQLME